MLKQPQLNSNFLVDIGTGDPHHPDAGFCEVVFPTFRADSTAQLSAWQSAPQLPGNQEVEAKHLILRRGVTASLDLYAWWDLARRGHAPKQRNVKVQLLAADHSSVVLTWLFRHVRPVGLSYSALNAMQNAVQVESIELDFDGVEITCG